MSRITTPFSFHSTASEIIEGINLTGKRAIVTGGASGIGIETARALAGAGASVTLAVRRPDAAEPVAIELRRSTGNHAIVIRTLSRLRGASQRTQVLIRWRDWVLGMDHVRAVVCCCGQGAARRLGGVGQFT